VDLSHTPIRCSYKPPWLGCARSREGTSEKPEPAKLVKVELPLVPGAQKPSFGVSSHRIGVRWGPRPLPGMFFTQGSLAAGNGWLRCDVGIHEDLV
jgi:hypothetical protein